MRAAELGYPAARAHRPRRPLRLARVRLRRAAPSASARITGGEASARRRLPRHAARREHRAATRNLCRLLTAAHARERLNPGLEPAAARRAERGPRLPLRLRARAGSRVGTRTVPPALADVFGRERFFVELQRPYAARRRAQERALSATSPRRSASARRDGRRARAPPAPRPPAGRARRRSAANATLDACEAERRGNREYVLSRPAETAARFPDEPEAVRATVELAERLEFDLTRELGYRYPDFSTASTRRTRSSHGSAAGAFRGSLSECSGSPATQASARLDEELALIAELGLSGFFLLHWEVLELAREVALEVRGRDSPRHAAAAGPRAGARARLDRLLPDRALARRPGRRGARRSAAS